MAETTGISWADSTWNVAVGCTKVSEGCKNCYMIRDFERKPMWVDVNGTVTRTTSVFDSPLKWKEPKRIFTSSLTDLFHEQIDSYRWEAFDIMRRCPQHQFQVLTKRIERFDYCLVLAFRHAVANNKKELANWLLDWSNGKPPVNVWVGVSVACVKEMHRLDALEHIPAHIRFVSFEPLIEQLPNAYRPYVDWIIIGGESGPASGKYAARPCHYKWITDLIEQYQKVEYPAEIFVKQLGSVLADWMSVKHPKGEDPAEWPFEIQLQNFPEERLALPVVQTPVKKTSQTKLFL